MNISFVLNPVKEWISFFCFTLSKALDNYFNKTPAFAFFLWILLGAGAYFLSLPLFLLLLLLFTLPYYNKKSDLIKVVLLSSFGYFYSFYHDCPSLPIGSEKLGKGFFFVTEKKETTLFGKKSLLYKGILKQFTDSQGKIYKNIPCHLTRPLHIPLCIADKICLDHLTLIVKDRRSFCIKVPRSLSGDPYGNTFSLTEKRYRAKTSLLQHLQTRYRDKKTYSFIAAMAAGYLDNKTLMHEFSKTGIQHLLTISGFHFTILAFFISALFKPWLPKKTFICCLLLLLTFYVIYLGPSPSVSRSWIAAILMLIAYYFEIPSNPINYLSIAGLIAFLENPLCLTTLGFQLSYLATFGIISYFSICEKGMQIFLPTRSASSLFTMRSSKQIFCLFLILLRKSLSLDNAVNLMTIPVIFYYFGSFPIFSFYFNLIIPLLLLPSLYLLLFGLLLTPFTFLETTIHSINNAYTKCILDCVASCPKTLETCLTIKNTKATTAVVALVLVFILLLLSNRKKIL